MSKHHILLVDDDPNILTTLGMRLDAMGYRVTTAADGEGAVLQVEREAPDLMLLDLRLPKLDGLQVLAAVKESAPDVEVIVFTAQGTVETAVAAIKAGAFDYLEKPINTQRLGILLDQAMVRRGYRKELGRLRSTLKEMGRFGHLFGRSEPMEQLYALIEQVADTNATVLVTGESGTGKELVARTIHDMSSRRNAPFVAVNCSAIMSTLWESEMFGYEKGAFTGAIRQHAGYIEQASGGTLFLDELGEMSLETQVKFLRVLETRMLKRVGGAAEISVDIRVVAATNRNLEQAIAEGKFRDDLYYRINVFTLNAPPLRERRVDVPLLADGFMRHYAQTYGKEVREISEDAMTRMKAHDWPGNVRELRNVLERAVIVCGGNVIERRHLPPHLAAASVAGVGAPGGAAEGRPEAATIGEMERMLIFRTLDKVGGNKTQAARLLGISLKTLHNKLARYREEGLLEPGSEQAKA
ncbi:MAG: sigma-54 dependent transcriptional regulator [Nitrospirota bacterium]|nr:sigma-54 dependent transcriptional regulator [Nitrospirota bacterium]